MQVRRPALWIVGATVGVFLFTQFADYYLQPRDRTVMTIIGTWIQPLMLFYPLAAGLLLADRFTRDTTLQVSELFNATDAGVGPRLVGKYLGTTLATSIPGFLIYSLGASIIVIYWHALALLPLALVQVVLVLLPALLFVGAFSIACTTVMWPVLYQILFVGYWFWGNFLNPQVGIPTLNGTLLAPAGRFIRNGLLPMLVPHYPGYQRDVVSLSDGLISLLIVLGSGIIAQFAAWRWLVWRQQH